MISPLVTPMKKVYAWLSNEERDALEQYCKTEGKSMYAVLKEAVGRTIQAESSSPSPITAKQDSEIVAPSRTVQVVASGLEQEVVSLKRGFDHIQKEFNKISDHELLWQNITDIKERLARLETTNEGLDEKIAHKVEEVVEKVLVGLKRSV